MVIIVFNIGPNFCRVGVEFEKDMYGGLGQACMSKEKGPVGFGAKEDSLRISRFWGVVSKT